MSETVTTGTGSESIYDIPVRRIDGAESSLGAFAGDVVLVVNVASKCGFTPQYEGLEKMYQIYRDRGLVIAGFPCNDFAGQEPGTNDEIASSCKSDYGVDFPLFEKITVVGPDKHPLYAALIAAQPVAENPRGTELYDHLAEFMADSGTLPNDAPEVLWNFEKFLVSRDGRVIGRFSPDIEPNEAILVRAVEKAIG